MRLYEYISSKDEITETTKGDLLYVFDQVNWRADQRKRNNREAAEYAELSRDKKIDYFNKNIVPEFKKIGQPKPYSKELQDFIRGLFI